MKNAIGYLLRIALNMWIILGSYFSSTHFSNPTA